MASQYLSFVMFSPQEIALFWAAVLVFGGATAGLVVFAVSKLIRRKKPNKLRARTSFMIGLALVILGLLCFVVIPTMIRDSRWESKQQSCAETAGYNSPADNNDPAVITAQSQRIYSDCIMR